MTSTSSSSSADEHLEAEKKGAVSAMDNGAGLTDEQKKFLEQCESEFANRYTDQDKEFMQFCSAPKVGPPVVSPWFSQPPRQRFGGGNDRRDSSRGWDRDGQRSRDYGDRRDRSQHHEDRDGRGRHEHDRDRGRYIERRKY